MMNIPSLLSRPRIGHRHRFGFVLGLALVAAGTWSPGSGRGTVAAQASGPCWLLMTDEIQQLAPKATTIYARATRQRSATISEGVSMSLEAAGSNTCRYTWGNGAERFKLDIKVNDASRMFSGKDPNVIKQELQSSVKAETADAVISDVGEAAVFKADSSVFVHATSYLKGRILQVNLDGYDARDKKDQVIALLKSAASRL